MVNSCAAYNCTNRRVKGSGVKFHVFPLKNRELCEKWVVAIKRDHFVPTEHSYLCGDHFNASDYKYIDSNKLKDAAVPSKFAFPGHLQKTEQIRKLPAKRKHGKRIVYQCKRELELAIYQCQQLLHGCNID